MAEATPASGAPVRCSAHIIDDDGHRLRIRPRAGRGLVLIRARPDDRDAMQAIEDGLGLALPSAPNTTSASGDRRVYWLGPDEWVADWPGDVATATLAALQSAAHGRFAAIVDIGAGRASLAIEGSGAVDLLRKGCPIDVHPREFPSGACARTLLGRVGVLVGCIDAGREYHVVVDRSYADYLWQWLADAAAAEAGGTTRTD